MVCKCRFSILTLAENCYYWKIIHTFFCFFYNNIYTHHELVFGFQNPISPEL